MPSSSDIDVGSTVAGYRIQSVLGRGGMGVVFLAEDVALKRKVALKLLAPHLAGESSFRERFLAESEIAASLDHPNILPIYAAGEAAGRLFIAMRYVDGPNLRQLLRVGPLSPAEAVSIAAQLANALDAAHAHGLIHRDVKPSNALIAPAAGADGSDHVYLADFGLSRRVREQQESGSSESLMGTVEYVAPEQIESRDVDSRADVYALGCLLYECLTGVPPFQRNSAAATLFAHMNDEPPRASQRNPSVPEAVDPVIARALAKSADERYQSCRDFVQEARAALGVTEPAVHRVSWKHAVFVAAFLALVALVAFLVVRSERVRSRRVTSAATKHGESAALRRLRSLGGASVVRIDPRTRKVVAVAEGPPDAVGIALDELGIWVAGESSGLVHIDPATTLRSEPNLELTHEIGGLAVANRTLAVATEPPGATILLFDLQCVCRLPLREQSSSGRLRVAADKRAIWVADSAQGVVSKIDARHGRFVGSVQLGRILGGHRPEIAGLAVGGGGVWVIGGYSRIKILRYNDLRIWETVPVAGYLWHIDVSRHRVVARVRLPSTPDSIAVGAGSLWITSGHGGLVWRIDPATTRLEGTTRIGTSSSGIVVAYRSVWVTDPEDGSLARIDPANNRVADEIAAGPGPEEVLAGPGGIWITHWAVQAGA